MSTICIIIKNQKDCYLNVNFLCYSYAYDKLYLRQTHMCNALKNLIHIWLQCLS